MDSKAILIKVEKSERYARICEALYESASAAWDNYEKASSEKFKQNAHRKGLILRYMTAIIFAVVCEPNKEKRMEEETFFTEVENIPYIQSHIEEFCWACKDFINNGCALNESITSRCLKWTQALWDYEVKNWWNSAIDSHKAIIESIKLYQSETTEDYGDDLEVHYFKVTKNENNLFESLIFNYKYNQ